MMSLCIYPDGCLLDTFHGLYMWYDNDLIDAIVLVDKGFIQMDTLWATISKADISVH